MSEPDRIDAADVPSDATANVDALIASLRAAGADRFDPVRLRYIDALARRAQSHLGSVKHLLDSRLAQALAVLKERLDTAQSQAREAVARGVQQYPHAAKELERLFAAGDFKGLRQLLATLKANEQSATLRALVRELDQQASESAVVEAGGAAVFDASAGAHAAPSELKTIRQFRETWSKLSVEKQVSQALEQAPKNAGPINSHMLVLRSLVLMRDISPDYLNRFISYTDTLLSLDPGEKEKPVIPKKTPAGRASKK